MKDERAILYVQTSNDPERQFSPLVLAQTAKAMGLEPTMFYMGMSLTILRPGEPEKIQVGSFSTFAEMLARTMEMEIPVLVCEPSKQLLGLDKVELIDGVKIVGAATLNDLALDAGATMWF